MLRVNASRETLVLPQGIKVKDAASKKRIRQLLAQELAAKMDLDGDEWEEMTPAEVAEMNQIEQH